MQQKINDIKVAQNSTSSLLVQSKNDIKKAVDSVILLVQKRRYDPLKALIFATKLKEMGDTLEKGVRQIATDESKLSKGEIYTLYNVEVSTKKVGVSYDFTVCNYPTWVRLKQESVDAAEALKKCETMLKGIPKKMTIIDEDSGEIVEVFPPNKLESDGLALKIK